jgi:methyltransferase
MEREPLGERQDTALIKLILIALAIFIPMLLEARRAAANEQVQRALGGIEPADDVYKMMRVAYPATFLAMIVEGALRRPAAGILLAAGAAVFVFAKALKWWAILTLGGFWTFRVIVVPGESLVVTGPYRWLRHPNYLAVVGELVGTALMTAAAITGPLATAGFCVLLSKRISIEDRALGRTAAASRLHPRA